MNPIISPLAIYLINLMSPLRTVFIIATVLFACLGLLFGIDHVEYSSYSSEDKRERAKKSLSKCKKFCVITVFFMFMSVLTPTKETLIEMIVAQNITVDNINTGEEKLKEAIDYLVDKVKETKE